MLKALQRTLRKIKKALVKPQDTQELRKANNRKQIKLILKGLEQRGY